MPAQALVRSIAKLAVEELVVELVAVPALALSIALSAEAVPQAATTNPTVEDWSHPAFQADLEGGSERRLEQPEAGAAFLAAAFQALTEAWQPAFRVAAFRALHLAFRSVAFLA